MSPSGMAVAALLALAVLLSLACCLGLAVMRDIYERLHYIAGVSTTAFLCVMAAVFVQEGWGQASLKTAFIAVASLLMSAVLTHATARAARVRELGHREKESGERR